MNIQNYFVTGNTSAGFVNFLSTNLTGIEKIIILKNPSDSIKTNLFNRLITNYKDLPLEIIKSDLGEPYIDGVIIRSKKAVVLSDRITADLSEQTEVISFGEALEAEPFISALRLEIKDLYERAYRRLKRGLEIHDDLEAIYIQAMDFDKADQLVNAFIEKHIKTSKVADKHDDMKCLFGTMTYQGMVTIVPQIIKKIPTVFHIKGRAGTGKSYFMRRVMNAAKANGYFVREYRCSFDPESIDMIHIPELKICLLDSTDPHSFMPERPGEEIIDLYEETIELGTDEKNAVAIQRVMVPYKKEMYAGVELIKQAGKFHELIEDKYRCLSIDVGQLLNQIEISIEST